MKLLAPNGKPSNLTPEQYKLVRTPAFKAWFGDWENSPETASKVVDKNGEPLVVYRTDESIINKYKKRKAGIFFQSKKEIISAKLADGTNTTFDSNNPDIRYAEGGIVTEKTEILYHGTSLNRANKILKDGFDLERQSDKSKQGHKKAISFTSSYQEAKEHSDWAAEKFNDKPAIISIAIPFEIMSGKSFFDMNMDMEKAYKLFELKKIDGVSFCDYETGDGCEEMEVAIFNVEKLNKNKLNFSIEYSSGGEINSEILSSQEVENKLGRKLHWWNDDVVTINGAEYKKVFLKPEYKRL